MIKHALSIGLLASAMASSQAQELVTNGSFNVPLLTGSALMTDNVPGWSNVQLSAFNFTGYYASASDATSKGFVDGYGDSFKLWQASASPDGGSFLGDDGDPNFHTSIQQTISGLTPGQGYVVSFYFGGGEITRRDGPTTEWWDVNLGSDSATSQRTAVLSTPNHGFANWQKASMTFVATSTQELLSFTAGGTPNGAPPMALLDGVSMVAAVPEPASYACFALGLGLLGAARHRARQSRRPNAA